MKMRLLLAAAALLMPLCAPAQGKKVYGIEDFIKKDRFGTVKISPKGTYAAATVPQGDKTLLVILKPGSDKPHGYVNFRETNTHVVDFTWVNDERILFSVGEKAGSLERPASFGEIWGTNADGSRQGILVGARADSSASRAGGRSKAQASFFLLIDDLPQEDDHVLVAQVPFAGGDIPYTSVERMNVNSGTKVPVARAPVRGSGFLADNRGVVRFAAGRNKEYDSMLYYRASEDAEWQVLNNESMTGRVVVPLDFNVDDSIAYFLSEEKTGPSAVLAYDVLTGKSTQIARDDFVDPSGLVYAIGKRHPIGVSFMDGKPRYEYFNPDSPEAKLHKSLQQSFGGDVVSVTSATLDGTQALLMTWSDRNPGDYYVFDTAARKADLLISKADWIEPARMAEMKPVRLKARDGRQIEALLTVPRGSTGKNLPLIVNPHGGPFGVQDTWEFAMEPQLLASQGYAVLQVNFRGSGGYGREFERSGYKQWGRAMQDDVTDATRWAIGEGIADANRICIYGASYGAYASLMGVAKEPNLYRCAIGYVGVYDLPMFFARGDIPQSYSGRDYLEEAVGRDNMNDYSPARLASRIKVPVFLTAGGEDQRTPQAQTEMMERALKAAGVPVESLYYPTEGHGYYKIEHNRELYTRMLAFLQRHIGGAGGAAGSE
jgi:dipeptidyl aminopeptidase/acylaminoacyl peptidase